MYFEVLQCVSLNARPYQSNEDRVGATSKCAWVIDGATDLGKPGLLGRRGGASWLATEAHFALTSFSFEDCDQTCRNLFHHLSSRFEVAQKRAPVAKWELPTAAFALAQLGNGKLEVAWAADCTIIKLEKGSHTFLTTPIETETERQEAEALGPGIGAAKVRSLEVLDDRRSKRMEAHYKALSPRIMDSEKSTSQVSFPISSGDIILLMTDGFSAIFDRYGLYSYDQALSVVMDTGLIGLASELRKEENRDARCLDHPRFKLSDDASALLVKVAP